MAQGGNSIAAQLLLDGHNEAYIRSIGTERGEGIIVFADKSFIELRQFENHQAFLANGWSVTPC